MYYATLWLIIELIHIYQWVVIIYVLIGLGVYLKILNPHQEFLRKVTLVLAEVTEPVLKFIRKVVPPLGSVDLSPLILLLLLQFLERVILYS